MNEMQEEMLKTMTGLIGDLPGFDQHRLKQRLNWRQAIEALESDSASCRTAVRKFAWALLAFGEVKNGAELIKYR